MVCLNCNSTGLIPFIKRDGSVSRFAKAFCPECHEEGHYRTPSPDDIDFACSYDWRSYFEEMATGKPLESIRELEPPQPLPAILPEHRLSQKVREIEGKLNNTRMKILEHIVLSKKKRNTINLYNKVIDIEPCLESPQRRNKLASNPQHFATPQHPQHPQHPQLE